MTKLKFTLVFLLIATVTFAQESPRKQATGKIGNLTISIDYGAPSVKGRTIWGGLEKYGNVWRAGANENTTFSFDKEVKIGGKKIPAGTYGFFMIPNKNSDWVIILNSKNNAWGAFAYKQDEDILRINIAPKFVDKTQEMLQYKVDKNGIKFAWGKARIYIPVN